MPDEHDDTPRCECCGEPLDPFQALVSDLEAVTEDHDDEAVVNAFCLMLGGIIASAETRAERRVLRKLVDGLISDATKLHTEEAAKATPTEWGEIAGNA